MTSYNLNDDNVATFDSTGKAVVTFTPPALEYWDITSTGIQTNDPVSATVIPVARVTLDGVFKEGSYSGNMDGSDTHFHVEKGQQFVCTWTGGTPGRVATFTVNGTRTLY